MKCKLGMSLPIFLLLWYVTPSLVMVFFNQTSLSTGILLVSVTLFLFKNLTYRVSPLFLVFFLSLGMCSLISIFFESNVKSVYSILVLLFISVSLFSVLNDLSKKNAGFSCSGIRNIYSIFIVIGVLGVFRLLEFGAYSGKAYPVPPFSEHSHFALAFAPISIYIQLACYSKIKKLFIAIVPLLFGVAFPSLVFMILAFIQLMLVDKKSCFYYFSLLAVLLSVVIFSENESMEYFRGRILFDSSDPNLSNLVYLQGWENAYIALKETSFIGLGFQNNGMQQPGTIGNLIFNIYGGDLNRLDGGFLASKIISEFGFFGILFFSFFIFSTIYLWWKCFDERFESNSQLNVLFYSLSFSLLIEIMFRGYGYFSPTFILYITSVAFILSKKLSVGASYA
ncbi:MAG: hypothetical protein ACRDC6_28440 [Shewanella sp.]